MINRRPEISPQTQAIRKPNPTKKHNCSLVWSPTKPGRSHHTGNDVFVITTLMMMIIHTPFPAMLSMLSLTSLISSQPFFLSGEANLLKGIYRVECQLTRSSRAAAPFPSKWMISFQLKFYKPLGTPAELHRQMPLRA